VYYNKQIKQNDCGAATAATVFGIPYAEAFNLCKTAGNGTKFSDVFIVAKKLNNDSIFLSIGEELSNLWWLHNLSKKYPIYLGLSIKRQLAKRGRPNLDHHAVAAINGKIYDPANDNEIDIDCFSNSCKSCIVNSMIIFGKELETYGKGNNL
jgi:hypothetical protein